jgi:polyvinyl alcohol dehydrogenase (cytochrome)
MAGASRDQSYEPEKRRASFNTAANRILEDHPYAGLLACLAILITVELNLVLRNAAASGGATSADGERLYRRHCAQCHSKSRVLRTPQLSVLRRMQPQDVLDSLEFGTMRFEGLQRSIDERRAIAEFVTGQKVAQEQKGRETLTGHCRDRGARFEPSSEPRWNGWGAGASNARFQPAADAELTPEQLPKLKVKWAFGFPPNTMLSQPTVVGGRVFVGTLRGSVYSLDAAEGCLYWSTNNPAGVRSAMTVGRLPASNPPRYALYFGDVSGNVHALDAENGSQLWTTRADYHPMARITGAPVLYLDRLYVPVSSTEEGSAGDPRYPCCTFRGSVVAFDSANGKKLWQSYTIQQKPAPTRKNPQGTQLWGPSGAAIWSAPTIDAQRGVIYVTTGDNYSDPPTRTSDAILALNLRTGRMLWSRQFIRNDAFNGACMVGASANCPEANGPDLDFGSSAILRTWPNGKRILVAGQKSGVLHAIDPDRKGATLWEQRVGRGSALGGIQWGPAADDLAVYAALSDIGIKLKQAPGEVATVELNGQRGGGILAYDLASGERRWMASAARCGTRPNCSPAQSAAVSVIPGAVFSGAVDGHLRAYSTQEGKVLWDYDTARQFKTINAIPANGGSLDGPGGGPTVAGGMLFLGSGYSLWGGMPGSVLLGFSVDGK